MLILNKQKIIQILSKSYLNITLAQFEHVLSPGWTIFVIHSTWFEASAKPCGESSPTLARVACVCQCANGGGDDAYIRLVRVCWGWKCRQLKYLSIQNRSRKATKIRLQNRKQINNKKARESKASLGSDVSPPPYNCTPWLIETNTLPGWQTEFL